MFDRHGRLHDARGRFARTGRLRVKADEPGERAGNRVPSVRRSGTAFQPPTLSTERRAAKELVPTRVREVNAVYAKRERGEKLSYRERAEIEWASPRKSAEQRAKTGDAVKPHREMVGEERSYARNRLGLERAARTGIKTTFSGRPKVERGNFRELLVPTPGRLGSFDVRYESRVRRAFDWPSAGGARVKMAPKPVAPKPATTAAPTIDPSRLALTDTQALRTMAKAIPGVTVPPRAGRNQLIALITGARR